MRFPFLVAFIFCGLLWSCEPNLPVGVSEAYHALPSKIDYNLHVKPILSDKCFACHGPDKAKQKAGLRLDLEEFAYADLPENPGKVAIDPGNPEGSELFHRILSSDPDFKMPSIDSHLELTDKEKAILIKWIDQGAAYKKHWAFVKPEKPEAPESDHPGIINPIDQFVLEKLRAEGLQPSPEAPKEILLRRLSMDLTGLPPTIAETDAFIHDPSPDAYEKEVDRLLASVHYGEKMAVDWLDLARFADSHGYTVDRLRDMSPYRDWVIDAFNKNVPYDTFIQWQLAGDLMPHPTKEMMIATAFNRNHQQNTEGGIIEKEFQTEYVIDRTNTFGDAFLGLPINCARCHDHKYDPISQKNYYELFSFFNNVREAGQISWDDALPTPTLMLPSPEQEKIITYIKENIRSREEELEEAVKQSEQAFQQWLIDGRYKALASQKIPTEGLQGHYTFDDASLKNSVNLKQAGVMMRETGKEKPAFASKDKGHSLLFDGDVWLDLQPVGVFSKSEPFSIGIKVIVPAHLKEGVILHKCIAERLYNYKGYHLYIQDGKLELSMAHTAPSDAIQKITKTDIPRDRWVQLTITYDGSSRADGLHLYLDGDEMEMTTVIDQLNKDILLKEKTQPGLQVGAWWRGWGLKGGQADDILVYNRVLTPFEVKIISGQANWGLLASKEPRQLSPDETEVLKGYYRAALDPGIKAARTNLSQQRKVLADTLEPIQELMVMQEMTERKKSYRLQRGSYDAPAEEVFPNTPEAVFKFPSDLPRNRLGLAQWLVHEDHPLTSRVAVNRYWQNFFGTGLVKTTEDFGNQGELPSHPELLDWLAVHFRESGWNVKDLNKLIVMSATYRQDSRTTREVRDRDPENRLLSHGPSYRMPAEMIRDNALAACGLLNDQIGGPSIKPYQPEGLWQINSMEYKADTGKAVYRRSLYVFVKRSVPNPTLSTFDATSRSYCVVRRQKTNTPLQALVTLNDPTFLEAAKVLGEQMTRENDLKTSISKVYRRLTGRSPEKAEIDLLTELQAATYAKFKAHPEKAKGWLKAGQYKTDRSLDQMAIAANAVVSSTILNSDAALTKR